MFRAICVHHQEVKFVLYSIWYYHTCRLLFCTKNVDFYITARINVSSLRYNKTWRLRVHDLMSNLNKLKWFILIKDTVNLNCIIIK